ncbi:MAG: LysR family transcriptional regulator [Bryobacteraceae bacterium]|nr:LysR family transcriptional regulator [Bryobacteraceae bacterium]
MDPFHLRLFRDIAQSGSMSRGAEVSQISQSAASQYVAELENRLGLELIDRTRRPLKLTEAGTLYLDFCRDVLRRFDEFDAEVGQLKSAVAGSVRVAAIFSVGLSEMQKLQAEFARRWPQAELEVEYLHPEKVYRAVRADEADIGLVSYPQPAKDLSVIDWREEEMAVAVAADHPLARRPKVTARQLQEFPFVSFDTDLPIRREVDRFLREQGAPIAVSQHFGSIPEVKEALAVGQHFAILPTRMLQNEIQQGRLVAVPLDGPKLARPLGIIHLRKKRFNRAAQSLLALLKENPR